MKHVNKEWRKTENKKKKKSKNRSKKNIKTEKNELLLLMKETGYRWYP